MKPQIERALGQYLSIRERSRAEIERYLSQKKVDEKEIAARLDRWEEVGIVNDAEFIATLIRSYLHKGKGNLFIRQKLLQAGIPQKRASEAVEGIPTEELNKALAKRLEKEDRKLSLLPADKRRQKAFSILRASGFLSSDAVRFIDDWQEKG